MSLIPSDESSEYTESSLKEEYFYDKEPKKNQLFRGKVILFHGPYEAFNFIRHREGKLRALRGLLENYGYFVEYIAWDHFNRMGAQVNDKLVYTCRMTDLDYDGFGNNYAANRAFHAISKVLKRIEAWYLIKYFGAHAPYEYFSQSFGH